MNYDQLTEELSLLFRDLRQKKVDPLLAHELNNTAANIAATVRLGLLNAKMQGSVPNLAFFKESRKAAVRASTQKKGLKNG